MAQGTLQKMARQILAYCPSVPYSLAQQWVADRYRSITENILWSFKIGQGTFYTPASYSTGTVTMTNGSAVVAGSGTTFTSAMVGRQFQIGGFVFTIASYSSATSITLDTTWYGDTVAGSTYQILQAYITPTPTDFLSWISVIDPALGWRIRTGYNSSELDTIDPRRSSTGTPTLLAGRSYNSSTVARYELWPYSTAAKQYMYLYEKRVTDLTNPGDTPPAIIRSDILVKGALADLSRWPGTTTERNPFYDPYFNQYKTRDLEFRDEVNKILISDQNIYMTDLSYYTTLPYAPMDARFMQSHAF